MSLTKPEALAQLSKHGYVEGMDGIYLDPKGECHMRLVKQGKGYVFEGKVTPLGESNARQEWLRIYTDAGI